MQYLKSAKSMPKVNVMKTKKKEYQASLEKLLGALHKLLVLDSRKARSRVSISYNKKESKLKFDKGDLARVKSWQLSSKYVNNAFRSRVGHVAANEKLGYVGHILQF